VTAVHPIELLYRGYGLDRRRPITAGVSAQPAAVNG
jgi:hypothetical protein